MNNRKVTAEMRHEAFEFLRQRYPNAFRLADIKPFKVGIIMTLMMMMTLCLLVYAALEYRIRQALNTHQETLPNQKGQAISNPTARWVFQLFAGIHVLVIEQLHSLVLNLSPYHLLVLRLLGTRYQQLYSASG